MKNQVLQTLSKIQKRINESQRYNNTIKSIVETNANEIVFLRNKFELSEEEALFLAASCIKCIEDSNFIFDVCDIANLLSISNLEFLLYQKSFQSLLDKHILLESIKQPTRFNQNNQNIIPVFNKEFSLNPIFAENFI